jgi:hypothetical protein
MTMKYERIDWQVSATMERIVAEMTFDNFDQSMRFMEVLINFLREEKALVPQDIRRPARDERPSAAGIARQPIGAQAEAPRNAEAPQAPIEGEASAHQELSRDAGRCADQTPSKSTSLLAK